jgi:DNA polymerase III psi subunit
MSLNNISLPSQLLADLYQHSLVGGFATAVPQKPPVPFLGKNGKNILIVVNEPEVPYLPDPELDFLTKILTACQLSLMDVAIVNWDKAPHHDVDAMIAQFSAKAVLLFDLAPLQFGFSHSSPLYAVQQKDSVQFVAAPALHEIEKTKEAKNQLWMALKQIFGL